MPPKIAPPLPPTPVDKKIDQDSTVLSAKYVQLYLALTQLKPIQIILDDKSDCVKENCKIKAKELMEKAELYAVEYINLIKKFKHNYGKLNLVSYFTNVEKIKKEISGLLFLDVNNIFKTQYEPIRQLGGNPYHSYQHKYLKYKTKYLQLKNS